MSIFIRQHGGLFIYAALLMTAFNYMSHGTQDLYPDFLKEARHIPATTVPWVAILYNIGAVIGADVTIGHKAIVHACRIEDAALIGMGAIVLDGVVVRKHGFVGAGALVAPGKEIGEGELWLGNPAKKVRMLTDAEIDALYYSAQHYVRLKDRYLAEAPL